MILSQIKLNNYSLPILDKKNLIIQHFYLPKSSKHKSICWSLLSVDEKKKADRFLFEKDKIRYFLCRGILRVLLAKYLNCYPQEIEFHYSSFGKPEIASACNLQFNLSHTENYLAIALSLDNPVGIDVEYLRLIKDYRQIALHYFSENEKELMENCPRHDQKLNIFFQCWTRKEAFLKGIGVGLSGLDCFEQNRVPSKSKNPDSQIANRHWIIKTIPSPSRYVLGVAFNISKTQILVIKEPWNVVFDG